MSRARVLSAVSGRGAAQALRDREVAANLDLDTSDVRAHLDTLVDEGIVEYREQPVNRYENERLFYRISEQPA